MMQDISGRLYSTSISLRLRIGHAHMSNGKVLTKRKRDNAAQAVNLAMLQKWLLGARGCRHCLEGEYLQKRQSHVLVIGRSEC